MANKGNAMLCDREVWLPIEGYEGLYEVSNYGNVKSLNYRRTGNEKVLKPKSTKGYWYVGLYKNGKIKFFRVHRLVAEAFLPNPHNLPEVNHKDENKSNNRANNLEWCSRKYNNNYGSHNAKCAASNKGKHSRIVYQYTTDGIQIASFSSITEAAEKMQCSDNAIGKCLRGKSATALGFMWQYV